VWRTAIKKRQESLACYPYSPRLLQTRPVVSVVRFDFVVVGNCSPATELPRSFAEGNCLCHVELKVRKRHQHFRVTSFMGLARLQLRRQSHCHENPLVSSVGEKFDDRRSRCSSTNSPRVRLATGGKARSAEDSCGDSRLSSVPSLPGDGLGIHAPRRLQWFPKNH
jgi:hypothetical protein